MAQSLSIELICLNVIRLELESAMFLVLIYLRFLLMTYLFTFKSTTPDPVCVNDIPLHCLMYADDIEIYIRF